MHTELEARVLHPLYGNNKGCSKTNTDKADFVVYSNVFRTTAIFKFGAFCDNNVVDVSHLLTIVTKTSVLETAITIRHWLPFPFYKWQKSDKAAFFLLFHLIDLDCR